jgi:hypothetical protein
VHAPGQLGQVHTNPAGIDEQDESTRHCENEISDEGTVCKRPRVTACQAGLSAQIQSENVVCLIYVLMIMAV